MKTTIIAGALSLLAAVSSTAATFQQGDVFIAINSSQVQWRHSDGTLVGTLTVPSSAATVNGANTAGMAFDQNGNLYVTMFASQTVAVFDNSGTFLHTFGSGYNSDPESICFDAAGNAYVGQADGTHRILKFSPTGTLLSSFAPHTEDRGSDWVDMAGDQCTLYYTSEGSNVLAFSACSNTQLPKFTATSLPGSAAYAHRLRPNGETLVADTETIVRLNSSGTVIQTYLSSVTNNFFALNLDPDNTSFWTADIVNFYVYRIDIASGAVLQKFKVIPNSVVSGLVVFGEITAAIPPIIQLAPPNDTNFVGQAHTLCATIATVSTNGVTNAIVGTTVTFTVTNGPNAGVTGTAVTDTNGVACFTYVGSGGVGKDTIDVSITTSNGVRRSATAFKVWIAQTSAPPVIMALTSLTVSNDAGLCSASVDPSQVDQGSYSPQGSPLHFSFIPPPPFPVGTNHVTFVATDTNGLSSSNLVTIIVVDAEAPVVACSPDQQVEFGTPWSFVTPSANDNCGPAPVTVFSTVTNLGCGCTYSATRVWQAMDASGNTAYCTQVVAVVDTTAPSLSCPPSQTLEFTDEHGAIATFSVSATDACSTVTLTVSPASGSVFPIGATTVQVEAVDACSNTGRCSFAITVLGALGVKQDVLNEMLAARSNLVASTAYLQKFDLAIQHLELSLNPSNWIDQTHLDLVGGNFAINQEKLAVGSLQNLIGTKNGPLPDSQLQDWIDRLIKCDRLLAVVSIEDAAAAGLNANKIAEDWSFVAQGDAEIAAGHYENGIEHYRNAWRHALNLRLTLGVDADGTVQLKFVGNNSPSFRVEFSTDLVHWTSLGTVNADAWGDVQFTDHNANKSPAGFYRVVQQ